MTRNLLAILLLFGIIGLALAGGVWLWWWKGPARPAGPVSLRDAAHMTEHLHGYGKPGGQWWVASEELIPIQWRFGADATFDVEIRERSPGDLDFLEADGRTEGVRALSGTWVASTTQIEVTTTDLGDEPLTFILPLGWVDGKLRIDIGGVRYRREMGGAVSPSSGT